MKETQVTLYVAGRSQRVERTIAAVRTMLDDGNGTTVRLAVVDILECPQVKDEQAILVTPTLVRHTPLPSVRVVGDVADPDYVLPLLGLQARPPGNENGL